MIELVRKRRSIRSYTQEPIDKQSRDLLIETRHDDWITAEAYIKGLLGLPEHVSVESIISIGHPAATREPLPAEQLQYGKIRYNQYSATD